MKFRNRMHAAELLAGRLERFRAERPLVLGIPRGAVPMAHVIAERLGADLDVVLVHKLRAPDQPELAIGAIDEAGHVYLTDYVAESGASAEYLEREQREQLDALRQRRRQYTPVHAPLDPKDRLVILVDDGIATGSTMIAAIRSMRDRQARKVIAATAVAPPDTVVRLEQEADEVVCLDAPSPFFAIGYFFDDFSQVSDDDVIDALRLRDRVVVGAGRTSGGGGR